MKKKCINLVPHTHWDREWYFTSAKSKIYLINNMKEILDFMEQNPSYPCYVLDGQSVVLEDYLSAVPEDESRIKKLVEEDRLKIGPWYTQTDEMIVGAESIVRNLLYGKIDCDKFGSRMMIGYLPDSFGQTAAMPKILNGFGITQSLFWRGYSERLGIEVSEFSWVSDDGSKVTVQLLPINYSVGITMPNSAEALHNQLDKPIKKLVCMSTTDDILIPNGHDQMPLQQDIFEIIDLLKKEFPDFDVKLSSFEHQFDSIDKNNIPTIKGELLDGKYMRAHRSIFSTRADIKSQNTKIENKITNTIEPLASIAHSIGIAYQAGIIEEIWRNVLKNQAHDSIGCCCTDEVNAQVKNRFIKANNTCDSLIDFYLRKLIYNTNNTGEQLIVFNGLPQDRKDTYKVEVYTPYEYFKLQDDKGKNINYEIICEQDSLLRDELAKFASYKRYKIAFIDKIPAVGYKVYKILKSIKPYNNVMQKNSNVIENNYYKIDINKNGTLNITNKSSEITYNNVLLLEDTGDAGDSYDFSPFENDFVITSQNIEAKIITVKSKYYNDAKISYQMQLPKDESSRILRKLDSYIDVEIYVRLNENSPIIELNINVNNQAKDHRIRIMVPQNFSAKTSVADIQFGKLKRDVYDKALNVWEEEKWDERPDTIYPFLSYIHTNDNKGLAVLSNSVREFQIVDGKKRFDTIAITLFRSFGVQGRRDLMRRPGRASGTKTPTPDSQLIGKNTYSIAITADIKNVAQLAKYYISPIAWYSFDPGEDLHINKEAFIVPKTFSLFKIEDNGIILSSLKKLEHENDLCARFYNTQNVNITLKINGNFKADKLLFMDETQNDISEKKLLEFKPFEVKTIKLKKK